MSARILRKLDLPTLTTVANFQARDEVQGNRKAIVNSIQYDIEEAAVRHLVQIMSKVQLEMAVDTLEIDHGNNNPKSKMVLQKRLRESMVDGGVKQWLKNCSDNEVVQQIGKALGIRGFSTMGIRVLYKAIEDELDLIGTQIVFGALNLPILKDCAAELEIPNHEHATTKTALIKALTLGGEISAPQKAKRGGKRKPKFLPLEECETYDQIFQHYLLETLVAWCKDNGLKTSGTKKTIINRILAFNDGDTENTMADPTRVNRPKSTKPKSKETKPAPKPSRVSKRNEEKAARGPKYEPVMEEESSDEDMEDRMDDEQSVEGEEAAVSEEVVSEDAAPEEDTDMDLSVDDSEAPTSINGLTIAMTGLSKETKSQLQTLIKENGAKLFSGKKITKEVNVLIVDAGSVSKFSKLTKQGIKVVTEEYFKNLQ